MLYRGLMFASASGRLNGTVWSHNHGGPYVRSNSYPTDPQTARQIVCRDALTELTSLWRTTLSQDDRESWERYGRALKIPNRIGQPHNLAGWPAFCKQNFVRIQADNQVGAALGTGTAPPVHPSPLDDAPGIAIGADGISIDLTWSPEGSWEADQNNAIVVFVSDPQRQTCNWFGSPFNMLAAIVGDPDPPPTMPVNIPLDNPPAATQRVFYRAIFTGTEYPTSRAYQGFVERPA